LKFELRTYQEDAARDVLARLDEAFYNYRGPYKRRSSFALSAVMSAGKTVMAAAVIEALFNGSDEYGRDADAKAVVVWLTDDESLNNQTMQKMILASELQVSQLVAIDGPEFPEKLDARTVYFLNVQKLYDSSVKYTKPTGARSYSLWDTFRNTIEADDRDLYLVIDEAHKGMSPGSGRDTTVLRLIDGEGDRLPVPVVWGISATTARFDEKMKEAAGRTKMPSVEVPIGEVRDSGLLKDAVILRRPDEKGQFDTTLLRHAVQRTVEQSRMWSEYCEEQGEELVLPLLLIQVPNDPAAAEMERIVSTVQEEWRAQSGDDLPSTAIAHVFGGIKDLTHASRTIMHVDPEAIQDKHEIRILLAKNAVTTGWDCPRAEVLVSLRGSDDDTVIAQLMGRMFRTPLARRIAENDVLNTVVCMLPNFNQAKTEQVAALLEKGEDGNGSTSDGSGPTPILGPTETMYRNAAVPDDVINLFSGLPSETKPNPQAKPLPRLFSMATALAGDGLLSNATEQAYARLIALLDGQLAQHKRDVDTASADIQEARIAGLIVNIKEGGQKPETGLTPLRGDARVIDDAFSSATRSLTKAVAVRYQKHRAVENRTNPRDDLDLIAAKLQVAAVATVPGVVGAVNEAATRQVNDWLDLYDVAIAGLLDSSRAVYDLIRAKSPTPIHKSTQLPLQGLMVQTGTATENSKRYDTALLHLLSDASGNFPFGDLNGWEQHVVKTELERAAPKVIGWYRNPSQAKETSLGVPYMKADGAWGSFQPDFVFFTRNADGGIAASLIEPHRDHGDSLRKLRGLADFVERYPTDFVRVEFMEQDTAGVMKKLALTDEAVRKAVREANDAAALFGGPLAKRYL
jgi:type III restriction enzyme